MTEPARVCVDLLTYRRTSYALTTIRQAIANLRYDGPLFWHVADNGSPQEHVEACMEAIRAGGYQPSLSVTDNAVGYGGSYNLSTQHTHALADLILVLEDDWSLDHPLDLAPLVRVLQEDQGSTGRNPIACIRLGYLGLTQALFGEVVITGGQRFLLFEPTSPEPHVFSGHPRLETVAFERRVGIWPEGLGAGATEFEVAHRYEARKGVAWPMDILYGYGNLFGHIGTEKA